MLAVTTGLSAGDVTGILVAAAAVATLALTLAVRARNRTRSRWRQQDRTDGYEDDQGVWHYGATDVTLGYYDKGGVWHPGLDVRVDLLERRPAQRRGGS